MVEGVRGGARRVGKGEEDLMNAEVKNMSDNGRRTELHEEKGRSRRGRNGKREGEVKKKISKEQKDKEGRDDEGMTRR